MFRPRTHANAEECYCLVIFLASRSEHIKGEWIRARETIPVKLVAPNHKRQQRQNKLINFKAKSM